jgi:hypothetical protein
MNWKAGLERISLVWWGFWMICAAGLAVFGLFEGAPTERVHIFLIGALGIALAYAAHRLTCWVLAGFFSPGSRDA